MSNSNSNTPEVSSLPYIPLGGHSALSQFPEPSTPYERLFVDYDGYVRAVDSCTSVDEIRRLVLLRALEIVETENIDLGFVLRHAIRVGDLEDALHVLQMVIFHGNFSKTGISDERNLRAVGRLREALGLDPARYCVNRCDSCCG